MHEFRKKILTQSIVLACVIAVFGTFFFLFKKNIEHQVETIDSLVTRKQQYAQSASGIASMKKDWEIAQQYADALNSFVIKKDDLVGIPQQLKSLAQARSVTLVFTFGAQTEGVEDSVVQFTASMEGTQAGISAFLTDVERTYRTLYIETMDSTLDDAKLRIVFSGKILYK